LEPERVDEGDIDVVRGVAQRHLQRIYEPNLNEKLSLCQVGDSPIKGAYIVHGRLGLLDKL